MSTFGCSSGASLPRATAGPHPARTNWRAPRGSRCRPVVRPGTAPARPCPRTLGGARLGFSLFP